MNWFEFVVVENNENLCSIDIEFNTLSLQCTQCENCILSSAKAFKLKRCYFIGILGISMNKANKLDVLIEPLVRHRSVTLNCLGILATFQINSHNCKFDECVVFIIHPSIVKSRRYFPTNTYEAINTNLHN